MGRSLEGLDVLLFGGTGFIGSALRHQLAAEGAQVTVVSRHPVAFEDPGWVPGDLADASFVSRVVRGRDVVYHLVSGSRPATANADPAADVATSIIPSLGLLTACVEAGVRRLVYASSGGTVYGPEPALPIAETAALNPISAYGVGKLAIEKYIGFYGHHFGLDHQIARIANPYGPGQVAREGQGVVAAMVARAIEGRPFEIIGDGSVARDFVFIDDVAEALVLLAGYCGPHRVMNVGGGQALSVSQIADDIERLLGLTQHARVHLPGRQFDVPVNYLGIDRIAAETGWYPRTSWVDGLRRTVEAARAASERFEGNSGSSFKY